LARLQSWHQVVPYILIVFAGMVVALSRMLASAGLRRHF
jgi:hypothetical protein